jgi:hypothetical protein
MNSAQVVYSDRLALGAIGGQIAKQERNTEIRTVLRDQAVEMVPPCPLAPAARDVQDRRPLGDVPQGDGSYIAHITALASVS